MILCFILTSFKILGYYASFDFVGAPVDQWVKRWPTDLAVPVLSSV